MEATEWCKQPAHGPLPLPQHVPGALGRRLEFCLALSNPTLQGAAPLSWDCWEPGRKREKVVGATKVSTELQQGSGGHGK